jgi:histidine triad (HIT) family protein
MSDDCIFCSIADGDIPGHIVHETDGALAFLDANPLARGHTLVIPRAHHARLGDLDGEAAHAFYEALHRVVPAVERATGADATTVAVNDGEAAGQEVPHVHAHVVPRFDDDGGQPIHAIMPDRPDVDDEALAATADAIADAV